MWIEYNANPSGNNTNDCVIRALSKALDMPWEQIKILVNVYSSAYHQSDDSDLSWSKILAERGFTMRAVFCRDLCNLKGFCRNNPTGTYVVKLPNHVCCVQDGDYYDTWDSGEQVPLYIWEKGE